MTIKQLAQAHNITPAAIRHYEKFGLFDDEHIVRLPNGYRVFTKGASARLNLIKLGQMSGFSLREMATELRHWCDGGLTPAQKKAVIAMQLARIDQKISELQQTRRRILQAAAFYGAPAATPRSNAKGSQED
jgi:DNA-binding transcriptional MerR regulator